MLPGIRDDRSTWRLIIDNTRPMESTSTAMTKNRENKLPTSDNEFYSRRIPLSSGIKCRRNVHDVMYQRVSSAERNLSRVSVSPFVFHLFFRAYSSAYVQARTNIRYTDWRFENRLIYDLAIVRERFNVSRSSSKVSQQNFPKTIYASLRKRL